MTALWIVVGVLGVLTLTAIFMTGKLLIDRKITRTIQAGLIQANQTLEQMDQQRANATLALAGAVLAKGKDGVLNVSKLKLDAAKDYRLASTPTDAGGIRVEITK